MVTSHTHDGNNDEPANEPRRADIDPSDQQRKPDPAREFEKAGLPARPKVGVLESTGGQGEAAPAPPMSHQGAPD